MNKSNDSLITHLEALRLTLIHCVVATVLLYPIGYLLSPHIINFLVTWCFPEGMAKLHYFAPMEVFWVQLKLALIFALAMAYPWNMLQLWKFLLPALYKDERKALSWWIFFSSALFCSGIIFCVGLILPMLMKFSGDFATPQLQPILGLASFLNLAGWLMFAFGIMFQAPIAVLVSVRFNLVTSEDLSSKRPYVMAAILIIAAVITPPDVVSQILLAIPTWLLFELGLFLAKRMENESEREMIWTEEIS